jgi:hypothetical protein
MQNAILVEAPRGGAYSCGRKGAAIDVGAICKNKKRHGGSARERRIAVPFLVDIDAGVVAAASRITQRTILI